MAADIFRNFMLGQQLGEAQASSRATRNALGLHQRDPNAAREQLLRIGNFDALEGLSDYDTQARQERIRARMRGKPGVGAAPASPGQMRPAPASPGQPMPAQAGGTMAPRALMSPQPAAQQQLTTPSGAYTVGGADDPSLQGAPPVQEAEGDADPEAQIRNVDFVSQAVTQIGAGDEYGRLQQFAQAAWEEGDPETWQWASEQMNALHERATQQFMGRLNYLGMAANQLRTVPPQKRIQAAVQMLQQSPLGQGANVQQLQQMIQARADVNQDGSISDEELDGFQRGLMSIEAQFTQQLNERNAETNRINALQNSAGSERPLSNSERIRLDSTYDNAQRTAAGDLGIMRPAMPYARFVLSFGGNIEDRMPVGDIRAADVGLLRAATRGQTGPGVMTEGEVGGTLSASMQRELRNARSWADVDFTKITADDRRVLAEYVMSATNPTTQTMWDNYNNANAEWSGAQNAPTFEAPRMVHPDDEWLLQARERSTDNPPTVGSLWHANGRIYSYQGRGQWRFEREGRGTSGGDYGTSIPAESAGSRGGGSGRAPNYAAALAAFDARPDTPAERAEFERDIGISVDEARRRVGQRSAPQSSGIVGH